MEYEWQQKHAYWLTPVVCMFYFALLFVEWSTIADLRALALGFFVWSVVAGIP